ncbi:MAG: hypothetical protein MJ249_11120, partial [Kiritimatiellae bacterium]|nr:hypothetical protein [Kiritimatiellia bacterium]
MVTNNLAGVVQLRDRVRYAEKGYCKVADIFDASGISVGRFPPHKFILSECFSPVWSAFGRHPFSSRRAYIALRPSTNCVPHENQAIRRLNRPSEKAFRGNSRRPSSSQPAEEPPRRPLRPHGGGVRERGDAVGVEPQRERRL